MMAVHEPSPEPFFKRPPSPFPPAQALDPIPLATITPDTTTLLEPVSDLSDIKAKGVEIPGNSKSPSGRKGKRNGKVTGQGYEGGPSKRRSGRKKAGNV